MTTMLAPTVAAPGQAVQALLARADVAAVVDQVLLLTTAQRRDLSRVWATNNRVHGISQIRICHRVSTTAPERQPDQAAVRAWVWTVAAEPRDGHTGAAAAASDMSFVLLAGDLLSAAERALFDAPWRAICADPVPGLAGRR